MFKFTKCFTSATSIHILPYNQHESPIEVAFTCLYIPVVQKSTTIKYINSKPPHTHIKIITKSRVLGFHPIYVYNN
jgi:hypothetical protein